MKVLFLVFIMFVYNLLLIVAFLTFSNPVLTRYDPTPETNEYTCMMTLAETSDMQEEDIIEICQD